MPNPEIHAHENASERSVPAWLFWGACALLTALYLSAALYRISDLPLPDPDEPRYAGAGRAMANGASLLVPEFNGEPRINKPPLFYWLVALSDWLAGGATETSSRAPSVAMGLLMLWGTIWLGRKFFGTTAGLLAGLILATTPLFMTLSRCCITDMTLSTFLAGTLGCLMLGMLGLAPLKKAGWIATLLFGLSVLTKATAAFAVLLSVVIQRAMSLPKERRPAAARWLGWMLVAAMAFSAGALLCEAKRKSSAKHAKTAAAREAAADSEDEDAPPAKRNVWSVLDGVLNKCALAVAMGAVGVLVAMAYRAECAAPALPPGWKMGLAISISMGLWWYILLIGIQGWATFNDLLYKEINQRVAGVMHREGMHYYLLMLPAVTFPWSPGLLSALGIAWTSQPPADESPREGLERRADSFLLAWILGIVFFFSIPGAKLPTYILPAMPAAALLTARFVIRLSSQLQGVGRHWVMTTQALALGFALSLVLFPIYLRWLPKDVRDATVLSPAALWSAAIAAGVLLPGSWLLAVRGRGRLAAVIAGCGTYLMIFLAAPFIIDGLKARSSKQLCLSVKDALKDCKQLKSMGVAPEGISYYLDTPVEKLKWKPPAKERGADILSAILAGEKPLAIFVDKRFVPRFLGKQVELGTLSVEELKRALPPGVFWVYSDQNVLVLRN